MFIKRNKVFFYNSGNNKSILLENIDAFSFEKVFQTTIHPNTSTDTTYNPRSGEIDQTYCIDYQGVYLIEETFHPEALHPQIIITHFPGIDSDTFVINKMLFPYYKDKDALYYYKSRIVHLNPRAYNKTDQIDQVTDKTFEELESHVIYQFH